MFSNIFHFAAGKYELHYLQLIVLVSIIEKKLS